MSRLAKKASADLLAKPADLAQVTVLIDQSDSMHPLERAARNAIARVLDEFKSREGMTLAVRTFNGAVETVAEFGDPVPHIIGYDPCGNTALYSAITESITRSKDDAALTPDIKTHHVIVVITDGEDTVDKPDDWHWEDTAQKPGPAQIAAQAEIDSIGVHATFILLDFSANGIAGKGIGLKGIKIDHNPSAFNDAMKKVAQAIGQIADNIVRQLPPASGLCLPPAR